MKTGLRMFSSAIGIGLVSALTISCTSSPAAPITDPANLEFAAELGVNLDEMTLTSSGLYLLDEEEGDGETAQVGDAVTVHYTGWFPDGQVFDSSVGAEPFILSLGAGDVIPGWDEGIQGMREGGHRLLVVPPTLAYGPNEVRGRRWATLVFRVELLELER